MEFESLEKILLPEMTGLMLAVKIFFILFDLGVIAFILYVWLTTIYLKRLFWIDVVEFFTFRPYATPLIEKDWNLIKKRLLTNNKGQFKLAVVEASKLLNDVLTRLGFEGKTLTDKIEKSSSDKFSDIDALKAANEISLAVIHDPNSDIDYQQAKTVILAFEQALRDVSAFVHK